MNVLRTLIGIAGLALLGLVVWALFTPLSELHGDFALQFGVIASLPWGLATLADLYVGYLLFAALVLIVERSWWTAAAWAIPAFFLGNIWAALWFVIRLPMLAANFIKPPREPPSL
jgi:hypothetical protein